MFYIQFLSLLFERIFPLICKFSNHLFVIRSSIPFPPKVYSWQSFTAFLLSNRSKFNRKYRITVVHYIATWTSDRRTFVPQVNNTVFHFGSALPSAYRTLNIWARLLLGDGIHLLYKLWNLLHIGKLALGYTYICIIRILITAYVRLFIQWTQKLEDHDFFRQKIKRGWKDMPVSISLYGFWQRTRTFPFLTNCHP